MKKHCPACYLELGLDVEICFRCGCSIETFASKEDYDNYLKNVVVRYKNAYEVQLKTQQIAAEQQRQAEIEAQRRAELQRQQTLSPINIVSCTDRYGHKREVYTFGKFQTNKAGSDTDTPIRWIKLKQENGVGLFIAEQILYCCRNHQTSDYWTESKKWLRDTFFPAAFRTQAERDRIVSTKIDGADEKVFLLSVAEAKALFNAKTKYKKYDLWYERRLTGYNGLREKKGYKFTPLAQASGTEYAREKGLCVDDGVYDKQTTVTEYKDKSPWWLNDSGSGGSPLGTCVNAKGVVNSVGTVVFCMTNGIRPALWLKL
ncbi:MAG: DUF6273 domain-containing protein [Firmicutes bacterium]|nr:DUF6273 domain-containing protein [Bacillota bacterium]